MTLVAAASIVHLAASLILFGMALFPLYAGQDGQGARPRIMRLVALVALIAGGISVAARAQGLGVPLLALAEAGIGRAWFAQLLLAAALVTALHLRGNSMFVVAMSVLNAGAFALVGHAYAIAGWWGAVVQAMHVLAAGAWLGGLVALLLALRDQPAPRLVRRFSAVGLAAVVTLAATGVVVLFVNTGAWLPMPDYAYGRWVNMKIILFAVALTLAAFNRLYATPRNAWRLLARVVATETLIIILIVAAAVALASTEPHG